MVNIANSNLLKGDKMKLFLQIKGIKEAVQKGILSHEQASILIGALIDLFFEKTI